MSAVSDPADPGSEQENTAGHESSAPAAPPRPPAPAPPYAPPSQPVYGTPQPPTAAPAAPGEQPTLAYGTAPYPGPPPYGQPPAPYGQRPYGPPPGAYGQPPYGQAAPSWPSQRPAANGSATLGIIAFVVAAVAGILVPVLGAVAGYAIGDGVGAELGDMPASADFDLAILAPVRGLVLFAEITFWTGTVLGIGALIQGIVAAVKARGRGWAIAAIVIAALGPIVYGTLAYILFFVGLAAGALSSVPSF